MLKQTSADMRKDPLFMRNGYTTCGRWGIPLVRKQDINLDTISLIACSDTRANDNDINKRCGVHFFC